MNEPYDHCDELKYHELRNSLEALSESEHLLKQLRPRNPNLDIETIACMVDWNTSKVPFSINPNERPLKYSNRQLVGTVAASWICGVLVGAASLFVFMPSHRLATQNSDLIASSDAKREVEPSPNATSKSSDNASSVIEADQIATNDYWQFDLNSEPLQVGMSLRSRVKLVRAGDLPKSRLSLLPIDRNSNQDRSAASESSSIFEQMDINFTPPLPTTNTELMREMLRDAVRSIH